MVQYLHGDNVVAAGGSSQAGQDVEVITAMGLEQIPLRQLPARVSIREVGPRDGL